ncbi:MAG: hypothetical protein HYY06_13300 [Deltaproteobacteria bacterium]|nr:hypothetical protein [Deltaproteobacteria bacterium]
MSLPRRDRAKLTKYVQYALVRPFLMGVVRLSDTALKNRVLGVSEDEFLRDGHLYRLLEGAIAVHPSWSRYLDRHGAIIRGWALWEWAAFMQRHNPNVPAVAAKLAPDPSREGLGRQQRYWRAVGRREALECIYTARPVDPEDLTLDHFVPWSFVVHDRLWNLVPVSAATNSSKGDRLPPVSSLEPLAHLQSSALAVARQPPRLKELDQYIDEFVADLGVDRALLEEGNPSHMAAYLLRRYRDVVGPLLALASSHGFEPWTAR